jgi:hypothetical protein
MSLLSNCGISSLLLPERELAHCWCGNDAAPAGGALTRLEEDDGAEAPRPPRGFDNVGNTNVRQPPRLVGLTLDDAAAESVAQFERQI